MGRFCSLFFFAVGLSSPNGADEECKMSSFKCRPSCGAFCFITGAGGAGAQDYLFVRKDVSKLTTGQ